MLDYQTDTLPAHLENAPLEEQAKTLFEQTEKLPKEWAKTIEAMKQTGVSEQFAWMLGQKLETLPQHVQQQIRSEFQKYLGSLESTNNEKMPFAVPEGTALPLDAQEVQDKLAALLLQLKTVPQEVHKAMEANVNTVIDGEAYAEVAQESKPTAVSEMKAVAVSASENKQDAEPVIPANTQPPAAQALDTVKTHAAEAGMDDMPETDFVKDNVIRIVDKVRTNVSEGKHEFDVDLKPDYLGKVSIRLTMENGSIRMHIRTEDMGAKGLFTDQMSGLQSLLKDKGLQVASVEVTCQSELTAGGGYEAYRQNGGHSGSDQRGARNGGSYTTDTVSGTSLYDAMAGSAEYYLGGSSIEYLA